MGGYTTKLTSGPRIAAALSVARASRKTGSIRLVMEAPASSDDVKKLVKHATRITSDSGRTDLKVSASMEILAHGKTWQPDIRGRSRQLTGFMCLFTFESPSKENTWVESDIVAQVLSTK